MGHRFRIAIPGLPLAALLAVAGPAQAWTQNQEPAPRPLPDVAPILERYESGTVPTPDELSTLAAMAADGRLLASLKKAGPEWLQADGPTRIDRRRLTLAAFVLEALVAEHDAKGAVSSPLIEWMCGILRERPSPLPWERPWHVATVALLEKPSRHDDPALVEHLAHARARFKDEPRLLFGDAWTQRPFITDNSKLAPPESALFPNGPTTVSTSPYFYRGYDGFDRVSQFNPSMSMIPSTGPWPEEPMSSRSLRQARHDYEHARKTPALLAEAELRLGDLDLSQRKPKGALNHFGRALTFTTDLDLEYLGQYLSGVANEALKRWPEAEAAYRRALAAAPHGRRAADALAVLLDRQGKADEAGAIRARLGEPGAVDPWTRFTSGDLVSYSFLLEQLRKAVW